MFRGDGNVRVATTAPATTGIFSELNTFGEKIWEKREIGTTVVGLLLLILSRIK
jgi:hypothetical protein